MANDGLEALIVRAADVVADAAVSWLMAHGHRPANVNRERLSKMCRKHVDAALPGALEEARSAYAANMSRFAIGAFGLAMVNAGIAAARETVAS